MIVLLLSVAGFVFYLVLERVAVDRWRESIPQTIIVTGTRGKSSVVRMLASVLRSSGKSVLAKTTGSSPRLLWPDGSETEIKRRGPASILEQKHLIKQASRLGVDVLVAEVMSIHPENHIVESLQILRPDIVVVTNTWPDHVDAQGNNVEATLALDIPNGATTFVPAAHDSATLREAVDRVGGTLVAVDKRVSESVLKFAPAVASAEFSENIDLTVAVARHLGIEDEVIAAGLVRTERDIGAFSIRELRLGTRAKRLFAVNAFAANDPESTARVLAKVRRLLPDGARVTGILCLRWDRADRTEQWIEALGNGMSAEFDRLYVTGGHARATARRLLSARLLTGRSAERLTAAVLDELSDESVLFGFGNYVSLGAELTDYWNSTSVAHGI